jgi:threonine/homoserine/homoserine lactone efflux protein
MPSFELLTTFFIATALIAYLPGPAMLYTTAQTIARGRRAGFMAALGIHVGGYVHVVLAAGGLSAILHTVPTLYVVIKIGGAMYLVWLGIMMFRRADGNANVPGVMPQKSGYHAFIESVTVEVLNPKVALFFIAFVPQFADPSAALPVWTQLLILGTFVNIAFSSADIFCVIFSSALVARLKRSSGAQKLLQRLGGAVLVGLGVNMALYQR